MNGIRAIAVVLSMVLLLFGASGNTKEETRNAAVSYESIEQEKTEKHQAADLLAELGADYMEEAEKIKEAEKIEMEAKAKLTEQEEAQKENQPDTEAETELREQPELEAEAELTEQPELEAETKLTEQPGSEAGTEPAEQPEGIETVQNPAPASGQRVIALSDEDYTALLRLVEAEASGEDIKGKMLVANVVINRLNRGGFGSTIKEVIYQRSNGKAQFSPVSTGKIDRVVVSQETVEAVERVLCGEDESQGALYFVSRAHANPESMAWFDQHLTWLFVYSGHEFFA